MVFEDKNMEVSRSCMMARDMKGIVTLSLLVNQLIRSMTNDEVKRGDYPLLPRELERRIFEVAADDYPGCVCRLMLVASRVHYWLASALYQIASQLPGPIFPPSKKCPTLAYTGRFVRCLIIGGDRSRAGIVNYLASCPNLTNIALWTDLDLRLFLPRLAELRLERLSADLSTLKIDDFKGCAFRHVTHLDVTSLGGTWEKRWQGLTLMPRLTHVAINELVCTAVLHGLLEHCPRLRILLVVVNNTTLLLDEHKTCTDDPRFVRLKLTRYFVSDWVASASGHRNMWEWAEDISNAKQFGSLRRGVIE